MTTPSVLLPISMVISFGLTFVITPSTTSPFFTPLRAYPVMASNSSIVCGALPCPAVFLGVDAFFSASTTGASCVFGVLDEDIFLTIHLYQPFDRNLSIIYL